MDLTVHAATQTGVGHSQQVRLVELQARVDLIVELVARAAGTGAQRATALNHELLDDAVEGQAVVELAVGRLAGVRVRPFLLAGGEAQEVGHGVRSLVVEQVDGDAALSGAHDNCSHGSKCLMGLRPDSGCMSYAPCGTCPVVRTTLGRDMMFGAVISS